MPPEQAVADTVDEKRSFRVTLHDAPHQWSISGTVKRDVCVMDIQHDPRITGPLRITVTLIYDGRGMVSIDRLRFEGNDGVERSFVVSF